MSIIFTVVYLVFEPVRAFGSISVKMENQYVDECTNSGKVFRIAHLGNRTNSESAAGVMS